MFFCCFKFQGKFQRENPNSLKKKPNQYITNEDKNKFSNNIQNDNCQSKSENNLTLKNNFNTMISKKKTGEATSDQLNDEKFLEEFSHPSVVSNFNKNDNLWQNEISNKNEYNFVESISTSEINQLEVKENDHSETTIINNNDDEFSSSSKLRLKNKNNDKLFSNNYKNNSIKIKTRSAINYKKIMDINNDKISGNNLMEIHGEVQLRPGRKKINISDDYINSNNNKQKNEINCSKKEFTFNNDISEANNYNKNFIKNYVSNQKKSKNNAYSFKQYERLKINNNPKNNIKNKKNIINSKNQYKHSQFIDYSYKISKLKNRSPNTTKNSLIHLINNSLSFNNNSEPVYLNKNDKKNDKFSKKSQKSYINYNIDNKNTKCNHISIENKKDNSRSLIKKKLLNGNCIKNNLNNNDKINFKVFTDRSGDALNSGSIFHKIQKKIKLNINYNTTPRKKFLKKIENISKTNKKKFDITNISNEVKSFEKQRNTYNIRNMDDTNEKYFDNSIKKKLKRSYFNRELEANSENDDFIYLENEDDNKINKMSHAYYHSNHVFI